MTSTQSPLITVENLVKTFGRGAKARTALSGIDLVLHEGESLGIVGESGSGKSTLARILIGIEHPSDGRVSFRGLDPRKASWKERARFIQIVFQDPYSSLDPRQTVEDALAEVYLAHGRGTRAECRLVVGELLDLVGLSGRQRTARPSDLSGGQRQRVAIARALVTDPAVLILDEAVSALDVSIQAQVLNLLADIREAKGVSYLFVTHDLAVVRQVCQRVGVLRRGELVETGPTDAVLGSPQHPYTAALVDAVPSRGWLTKTDALHIPVRPVQDAATPAREGS